MKRKGTKGDKEQGQLEPTKRHPETRGDQGERGNGELRFEIANSRGARTRRSNGIRWYMNREGVLGNKRASIKRTCNMQELGGRRERTLGQTILNKKTTHPREGC